MGFVRRVISSALNLENLTKHNANFADIETDLTEHRGRIAVAETELATQDGRINNLVVSGGDGNPEIVDAREDYGTLRERLDTEFGGVSAQLADIVINVKSRGAVLDGITDDITVINETILYVESLGGGTVLIPSGYAAISAPIILRSSVMVRGNGRDTTFIVPTFGEGDVFTATSSTKQKPRIQDLSIKPTAYRNKLVGINYLLFQYGSVQRVDVWRCGIGYYFDGSRGCYYNKLQESRAIGCGWGARFVTFHAVNRANANEIDDLTILSPIIGVIHSGGNTNLVKGVKIETLDLVEPTPSVDYEGNVVSEADRWALKIIGGTASNFEKFRAEFKGNLVSLGNTYGNYLRDFYCNFNGVAGLHVLLEEEPTSMYQTNNLIDVELGYSLPVLSHTYYNRHSRLTQKITLPPQIAMTLRDTAGPPSTGEKGLIRMDANANLWVGTDTDAFRQVVYKGVTSNFVKNSLVIGSSETIAAGAGRTISIFMSGLSNSDTISISTTVDIPPGFEMHPPKVEAGTGYARVALYNRTDVSLTLPAGTWTFSYTRL